MLICGREVSDDQIAMVREYAHLYLCRDINVLPSRPDAKRPMIRFKQYWNTRTTIDLIDQFPTSNLQCMTGRSVSRLLVIDLDGEEAMAQWDRMRNHRRIPRTWESTNFNGGRHIWFRVPDGWTKPLPKVWLWKGDGEHQAIERLCDKSLIVAPPSIHPKTGNRYVFVRGHDPFKKTNPAVLADCPRWILELKPVVIEKPRAVYCPPTPRRISGLSPMRTSMRPRDVVDAIPDKIGLAASWGVRFTGSVRDGWAECHAIDRKDSNPSAAVNTESGWYVDLGPSQLKLSFFDLGVALGQFIDRGDAVARLGEKYVL